jgi:hypothetical protein
MSDMNTASESPLKGIELECPNWGGWEDCAKARTLPPLGGCWTHHTTRTAATDQEAKDVRTCVFPNCAPSYWLVGRPKLSH